MVLVLEDRFRCITIDLPLGAHPWPLSAGADRSATSLAALLLDASRTFYTEVFCLRVVMQTPVLGLQAPDLPSAQVIVCPRGLETPQPDFGIDVGDPEAVDQAHARVHDRGLRIVYPLTDEPWGVRRFFVEDPTAASSTCSRTFPRSPEPDPVTHAEHPRAVDDRSAPHAD